jgi:hypothetical protein
MSEINRPISDKYTLIQATSSAATHTTAYIDMHLYRQIIIVVNADVVGTSVDAQVVQATDSGGTGSKNITGLAITQLTGTGVVALNVYDTDLDHDNDFDHVAITVTHGGVEENQVFVFADADNTKFPNFKASGTENSVSAYDEIVTLAL